MKTLISKGLVVKSSCPAKYMLTQEGKEAAHECIARSSLPDPTNDVSNSEGVPETRTHDISYHEMVHLDSDVEETSSPLELRRNMVTDNGQSDSTREAAPSVGMRCQKQTDLPPENMERVLNFGVYPRYTGGIPNTGANRYRNEDLQDFAKIPVVFRRNTAEISVYYRYRSRRGDKING